MLALALAVGCRPEEPVGSLVVPGMSAPARSWPLAGGRLAAHGARVVASDTDGDRIVVVDRGEEPRDVRFPSGWAPGAVATDGALAVVALGGVDAVGLVGLSPLAWRGVVAVGGEPRGVALAGGRVWVTAGGALVEVDVERGEVAASWALAPDVGDVVVREDEGVAYVARGRAAEVLVVALATGEVRDTFALPTLATTDGRTTVARALRRLVDVGDGRVAALHQAHVRDRIPLAASAEPVYGTGACDAVARPLVTWLDASGVLATVRIDAVLPVELAFWPDGDGAFPEPTPVVGAARAGGGPGIGVAYPPSGLADPVPYCVARTQLAGTEGPVTGLGVAEGAPVAVSRAPFAIVDAEGAWVASDPTEVVDAGFAAFHAPAPSGVACATCHVDGGDDGHTWQFDGLGARRTQALGGGLLATAPYHWDGALVDLDALYADTAVTRMGMPPAEPGVVGALGRWLDALPAAAPTAVPDPAQVTAGAEVFAAAGCPDCHPAPSYTTSVTVDVGTGGAFQVPSLRGVGARLPLLHDGCAATLEARFDPACGGDAHGEVAPDDIAPIVAFLETL